MLEIDWLEAVCMIVQGGAGLGQHAPAARASGKEAYDVGANPRKKSASAIKWQKVLLVNGKGAACNLYA